MKPNKSNFLIAAGPLLLVLFIDGMGLGLVIPILNGLIFNEHSTFLSQIALSPKMYNVIYGVIIGIFMLCWFFGASILGDLSDQIGRKKALIICLVGAFSSYLLSAIAVSLHSLMLLIIGRIIGGLTSGSQPIAQAAIIDLSTTEHKVRNIGFILLALSLGFIIGPLIGGILSNNQIVSWFDFSTPFYFAAIISFLNVALLMILFNETFISKAASLSINPHQAINIFISAFKNEKIKNLSIIFFIFIFGWSSFYSFISLYLLKTYNFTPAYISLFMAALGIGIGIGNGFLVGYLAKLISLKSTFLYSTLLGATLILLMPMVHQLILCWILVIPLACCISSAYAAIVTLFSNQVDANNQGWIMGITGSIMAFVWGLNGVTVGALATWSVSLPLYVAAFTLLLSVIGSYFLHKEAHALLTSETNAG